MPDSIGTVFPASFAALALAHFLALISPGPDFFLIIGHAARHRLRGSIGICAGIAVGNAVYIVLAIAGWAGLKQSPGLYRVMELVGAGYLVWMGVMLLRASRNNAGGRAGSAARLSVCKQFLAGMLSALCNPKNAVFYLTLMTVIIGPEATLAQQVASGAWMVFAVFSWDALVAACISFPAMQRILFTRLYLVERAAGAILILMALGLLLLSPSESGANVDMDELEPCNATAPNVLNSNCP